MRKLSKPVLDECFLNATTHQEEEGLLKVILLDFTSRVSDLLGEFSVEPENFYTTTKYPGEGNAIGPGPTLGKQLQKESSTKQESWSLYSFPQQ